MPKRKRGNNSTGPRKRQRLTGQSIPRMFNNVTVIPARIILGASAAVSTTALSVAELNLSIANCGNRIIDAGDIFAYFRIRKLHVYSFAYPLGTDTSSAAFSCFHSIAFTPLPNTSYTAPTTIAQMVDFPEFAYGTNRQRLSFSVGPEGLYQTTPTHWYECGTQGSSQFLSAGTITLSVNNTISASGTTSGASAVIEAEFEFKEPIDTALIPLSKLRARVDREEKTLQFRERSEEKFVDDYVVPPSSRTVFTADVPPSQATPGLALPLMSRDSSSKGVSTSRNMFGR
jgi:hypothetical protein